MPEHRRILARVGWLLIVVGALDIGFMIYCITNQMSYSSSLNIFAVVAGVFLVRGSLDTARIVTWFSAFMFSGLLLGSLIILPWLRPLEYWLIGYWEDPLGSVGSMVLPAAMLFMLIWVYRELRSSPVLEARATAGHESGAPRSAFIAGSVFSVAMAVMLQLTLKGESAEEAIRLAAEQHGADYRYFVSGISWAGRHVSARLTAYSDNETKEVVVHWER